MHVDEVFAAEHEFGGRLVNSMMTLAMVVGLSVNQLTQGTLVANLGFTDVRFPAPVLHGDTLRAETVVMEKRPSKSRPGQGVVTLQHVGYNQRERCRRRRDADRPLADGASMKPLTHESGPAYLFCPANRPDRYQKAQDRADFVIIDLEDAVAPADKAAAREALANNPIDADNVIVRINALGTPQSLEDLDVLVSLKYRRIMVAKAEDPAPIAALTGFEVIALCETAAVCWPPPRLRRCPRWWG